MEGFLSQAVVYLAAAVIAVPIASRMGLGSVLGYLAAGIIIGPVMGLVGSETVDLQHFAEFGVVMMLFVIGLELEPRALWDMRHKFLGLGGLQITGTIAVIGGVAVAFGLSWQSALAIGMIVSLSSTAIVLQTLNEKGLMPWITMRQKSKKAKQRVNPLQHLPLQMWPCPSGRPQQPSQYQAPWRHLILRQGAYSFE